MYVYVCMYVCMYIRTLYVYVYHLFNKDEMSYITVPIHTVTELTLHIQYVYVRSYGYMYALQMKAKFH